MDPMANEVEALNRQMLLAKWQPLADVLGECLHLVETCPVEQQVPVMQAFGGAIGDHEVMQPLKIMVRLFQKPELQSSVKASQVVKSVRHAWEVRASKTTFDEGVMQESISKLKAWQQEQGDAMNVATPSVMIDYRKHVMEIIGTPQDGFPFTVAQIRMAFEKEVQEFTGAVQQADSLRSFVIEVMKVGLEVKERSKLEKFLQLLHDVRVGEAGGGGDQTMVQQWLDSFSEGVAGQDSSRAGAATYSTSSSGYRVNRSGRIAGVTSGGRFRPYGGSPQFVKLRVAGVAGMDMAAVQTLVAEHIGLPRQFHKHMSWSYVLLWVPLADWRRWAEGSKIWVVWVGPRKVTMTEL